MHTNTSLNKYKNYEQTRIATNKLGIMGWHEYYKRYHEDPKLHSQPNRLYLEEYQAKGGALYFFTGKVKPEFYKTYSEAREATNSLGIMSEIEYKLRYKEDAKLPSAPHEVYKDEYLPNGGATFFFLGAQKTALYDKYEDARNATHALGIKSQKEYFARYKEDPKLPSHPWVKFTQEYISDGGADSFFVCTPKPYKTAEQTYAAIKKLGISSYTEYFRRYKEDPKLPSSPWTRFRVTINNENLAFDPFPNAPKRKNLCNLRRRKSSLSLYETFEQAKLASKKLGILSSYEYRKKYKQDSRLPSVPNMYYKDCPSNPNNENFFRVAAETFYETYDEARIATQNLGIKSRNQYKRDYKVDPKLPSNPWIKYRDVFQVRGGAKTFFLK
jgi:hypothetical protein